MENDFCVHVYTCYIDLCFYNGILAVRTVDISLL